MKSKLKFLTGVSLKRKIKTKWFVIANALIALVIIAGLNIDTIITAFGGEFNEKTTIYVIDHTNESYDLLKDQIRTSTTSFTVEDNSSEEAVSDQSKFTIKRYQKSEKEAKKLIADEKKTVVLVLDHSDQDVLTAKLISKDYLSTQNFQIINAAVNGTKSTLAFQKSNISSEELARINTPIKLEREYLEKDKNEAGENNEMIMGFVFPIIILPFFMLTLFLVQMIGAEVNDEKTTRGMEIIISNVSPKTHFFSKVIAGNLFVIIQSILLFIYGGIGLLLRTMIAGDGINGGITDSVGTMVGNLLEGGMGEKLIYIIPLTLLLMILTFISYSLLAGILASMTTNIEDFQQLQTPIIVISLAGYYLATLSTMFGGSLFIRIFSYIPLISAILSPSLLIIGQIGILDMIVAILLTIVTNYLLIKYGLKIYKVGILNYSSKGLWKKMFKALKD